MIRVAGLHDQVDAGLSDPGPDGARRRRSSTSCATPDPRARRAPDALRRAGPAPARWPSTASASSRLDAVEPEQRAALDERFRAPDLPGPHAAGRRRRAPVPVHLQPVAVARRARPRPADRRDHASPASRCRRRSCRASSPIGEGSLTFVALEELIAANLEALFPGMEVVDHGVFRVTRDADFEVSDEADDLLEAVEAELRRRRFGEVVRLEVNAGMSQELRATLAAGLEVEPRQAYEVEGLLDLNDLWQIVKLPGFGDLRAEPLVARHPAAPAGRGGRGRRTCSRPSARATSSCTTRTTRSRPRSSASSSRRSTTPTCSRSR